MQAGEGGGPELHWLDSFPITCPCPKEWKESCWGSGQVPSSSCEGEGNSSLDVTDRRMRAHPGGSGWPREKRQDEYGLTSTQDGVKAGEKRARRGQVWPLVFVNFKRSEVNGIWVFFCFVFSQCCGFVLCFQAVCCGTPQDLKRKPKQKGGGCPAQNIKEKREDKSFSSVLCFFAILKDIPVAVETY